MQKIHNSTGSISNSTSSWEIKHPSGASGELEATEKSIIRQANGLSMINLFKYYRLNLNEHSRKIVCPFKTHNGGRENTPSFLFYPDTNSFWCFGCKVGTRPCDFVAQMEGLEKIDAAHKIIEIFKDDCEDFINVEDEMYADKIDSMIKFSNLVREKIQYHNDPIYTNKIEKICKVYDALNNKYNLNFEALTSIIEKLSFKIESLDSKKE